MIIMMICNIYMCDNYVIKSEYLEPVIVFINHIGFELAPASVLIHRSSPDFDLPYFKAESLNRSLKVIQPAK